MAKVRIELADHVADVREFKDPIKAKAFYDDVRKKLMSPNSEPVIDTENQSDRGSFVMVRNVLRVTLRP